MSDIVAEVKEIIAHVDEELKYVAGSVDYFGEALQQTLSDIDAIEIIGKMLARLLGYEYIGRGCSRVSLRTGNYLIKFQIGEPEDGDLPNQNKYEVETLTDLASLQKPYLPTVYYSCPTYIIMEYVPREIDDDELDIETLKVITEEKFRIQDELETLGYTFIDVDWAFSFNWRLTEDNQLKIVDLGSIRKVREAY